MKTRPRRQTSCTATLPSLRKSDLKTCFHLTVSSTTIRKHHSVQSRKRTPPSRSFALPEQQCCTLIDILYLFNFCILKSGDLIVRGDEEFIHWFAKGDAAGFGHASGDPNICDQTGDGVDDAIGDVSINWRLKAQSDNRVAY